MSVQNKGTVRGYSLASGPNGMPGFKPYRYQGRDRWSPGARIPEPPPDIKISPQEMREAAAARRTRFAALRDAGKTVAEAAAEIGISADTGRKYETRRRKEAVR